MGSQSLSIYRRCWPCRSTALPSVLRLPTGYCRFGDSQPRNGRLPSPGSPHRRVYGPLNDTTSTGGVDGATLMLLQLTSDKDPRYLAFNLFSSTEVGTPNFVVIYAWLRTFLASCVHGAHQVGAAFQSQRMAAATNLPTVPNYYQLVPMSHMLTEIASAVLVALATLMTSAGNAQVKRHASIQAILPFGLAGVATGAQPASASPWIEAERAV